MAQKRNPAKHHFYVAHPLIAWLLGIARNHVMRALDRDSRYRPLTLVSASEPAAAGSDQLEELTRNEGIERLRSAIMALPPRHREVVVLCDLEEISYEDAARVLDCATGTIRSRLHRARALLAGRLKMQVRCPA